MRMNRKTKHTSFILCMVLIVAMALSTTGCNGSTEKNPPSGTMAAAETDKNTDTGSHVSSESTVLGEGNTIFSFTVVDKDGVETLFEIHTDKEIVGEALTELGLISGEEGDYGLYVKTVNGITADYDTDGKYWAFYVNGEYASTGVDSTPIAEGESYSFKVE